MKQTNERISPQTAQELLALASHIETQKHQEYVPTELMQAASEAGISVDSLQEALRLEMQARQDQLQTRDRQLRLALSSGLAGAANALSGLGAYSKLSYQPIPTSQISADTNVLTPNAPTPDGYAATYTGTVQQYLLNPEGRVDGLVLKNGLQVKIPPHLSQALTNLLHPQAEISIIGTPGMPTRFGQEVSAIGDREPSDTATALCSTTAFNGQSVAFAKRGLAQSRLLLLKKLVVLQKLCKIMPNN